MDEREAARYPRVIVYATSLVVRLAFHHHDEVHLVVTAEDRPSDIPTRGVGGHHDHPFSLGERAGHVFMTGEAVEVFRGEIEVGAGELVTV